MSSRHRMPRESRVYATAAGEASDVELMPAGDVTDGVVRVGGTIRRPHHPQSLAVAANLDWLEAGRMVAALTSKEGTYAPYPRYVDAPTARPIATSTITRIVSAIPT